MQTDIEAIHQTESKPEKRLAKLGTALIRCQMAFPTNHAIGTPNPNGGAARFGATLPRS